MTAQRPSSDAFDLVMQRWLDADAGVTEPEGLLETVLSTTRRTRRLPGWLLPERWIPVQLTTRLQPVPRLAPVLLLIGLLLLAVAAVFLTVGRPNRLPAPFGPAANGLIAYDMKGGIRIANADGTSPRAIGENVPNPEAPIFSPDGTHIAFWGDGSPDSIYVANVDGTGVTKVSGNLWIATDKPVSWSPDSRQMVFSTESGPDKHDEKIYVASIDDPSPRVISPAGTRGFYPAWSPDGAWIAFLGLGSSGGLYQIWIVRPDGSDAHPIDATLQSDFAQPQWAPRLQPLSIAYAAGSVGAIGTDLFVVDLPSEQARRVSDRAGDGRYPAWSPDGSRLAWLAGTQPTMLRIAPASGEADAISLPSGGIEGPIRWSPDGTMIYGSNDDKTLISIVTVDGSAPPVRITHTGGQGSVPDWQRLAP